MTESNHEKKRAAYIQVNTDYYFRKFSKMQIANSKISWNWCAFLFTAYWLIYRKMYQAFAIAAALELLLIPAATSLMDMLGALNIVVSILAGLYGNYLYMQHIDGLIDREPVDVAVDLDEFRKKNGGTTYLVWVYIGAAAVFNMISPFS